MAASRQSSRATICRNLDAYDGMDIVELADASCRDRDARIRRRLLRDAGDGDTALGFGEEDAPSSWRGSPAAGVVGKPSSIDNATTVRRSVTFSKTATPQTAHGTETSIHTASRRGTADFPDIAKAESVYFTHQHGGTDEEPSPQQAAQQSGAASTDRNRGTNDDDQPIVENADRRMSHVPYRTSSDGRSSSSQRPVSATSAAKLHTITPAESVPERRARSGSLLASSRWRIFGVKRPAPEWRRKASSSAPLVGSGPDDDAVTESMNGSSPRCGHPDEHGSPRPPSCSSAASTLPSPNNSAAATKRLASSRALRSPSIINISSAATTPDGAAASFALGRNYAASVVTRRNDTMMSGEAGRQHRAAAALRRADGTSGMTGSSSHRQDSALGSTVADGASRASFAGGKIMTDGEIETLVAARVATAELAVIERYERELVQAAEREASAVVALRLATHERDASRELARRKQARISELESMVESLAQRFLFKPAQYATTRGVDGAQVPLLREERVPQARDSGACFHPAERPEGRPVDLSDAQDRRLYSRLQDAIAAFANSKQSAVTASRGGR